MGLSPNPDITDAVTGLVSQKPRLHWPAESLPPVLSLFAALLAVKD